MLPMTASALGELDAPPPYPARIRVEPEILERNRLTTAFRIVLAIPHLILVGGPMAATLSWTWAGQEGLRQDWGAGGGLLGVVAAVSAIIAWFAILFTGRYPAGLYEFGVGVLRWNTRVEGYLLLLYDDYPPFSLR